MMLLSHISRSLIQKYELLINEIYLLLTFLKLIILHKQLFKIPEERAII